MASSKNTKALNDLYQMLGTNHFEADVFINETFAGNQNGRIYLTDPNSPGRIELESMDSDNFYTGFNGKYQKFQYDANKNILSINGEGHKNNISGPYKVTLKNIKSM